MPGALRKTGSPRGSVANRAIGSPSGGFHKLLHERNVSYDGTCPSAVGALVLATCDYLAQSHGDGAECPRRSPFEPLIEAAMTTAIRKVLMAGTPKSGSVTGPSPEMIALAAS
jgi:hypothetical protein